MTPAAKEGLPAVVGELVAKAMRQAFALGQTYWQQADSDSFSQQRKSDATQAKFNALIPETVASIEATLSALTAEAGKGEFQDWFDSWAKTRDLNLHRIEDGRLLAPTSSVAEDAFLSGCMIASIHYMELCRQEQNLALSTATPAGEWDIRLFDSQWVNIVNHANCYSDMDKEDAIAAAVKLTEQAMAANVRDGKWPLAASPRGASAGGSV
jgi:hypothetical protein